LDTYPLAQKHKLTSYDATYLEMAIRRVLPLATLDSELAAAAKVEHVVLLPGK
jgi:predicted nucleic acid-binding protein